MAKYKSLTDLLAACINTHGDLYDYSKVVWSSTTTNASIIEIGCKKHGQFTKSIQSLINRKSGCSECSGNVRYTTSRFIDKARAIHGDVYDYSAVNVTADVTAHDRVTIICKHHGAFQQRIDNHLSAKAGCQACAGQQRLQSLDAMLDKCRQVHGDLYDYSLVEWTPTTNSTSEIPIICSKHGVFTRQFARHIHAKAICPKCANRYAHITRDELVALCTTVHGDTYDYSLVELPATLQKHSAKIKINCRKHGTFSKSLSAHLDELSGCTKCAGSKGERLVTRFLTNNSINFTKEHTFQECRNPSTNRMLKFDFWLPDHNTCIEFHGKQHYTPFNFTGGVPRKWSASQQLKAAQNLKANQLRDAIKEEYCKTANIHLIVIPYTDITKIDDVLSRILGLVHNPM